MTYMAPKQPRAVATEERFLAAAKDLFSRNGFANTTIDEIAQAAGLHRGALLKRFGSKKAIVDILFHSYCDEARKALDDFEQDVYQGKIRSVESFLFRVSAKLEALQMKHYAANRSFNEALASDLEISESTNDLFSHFVCVLIHVIEHFRPDLKTEKKYVIPAAQLLVTLNYNYVLGAAPSLPRDSLDRHRSIVRLTQALLSLS